jgi:hypothetical protein
VQLNSPLVDSHLTGVISRGFEGSKSKLLAWGPSVRRSPAAALGKGDCRSSAGSSGPPVPTPLVKARYGGGQAARGCGSKMSDGLPSGFAAIIGALPIVLPSALRRNPGTSSSGSRTLKPGTRKLGRTLNMGAP